MDWKKEFPLFSALPPADACAPCQNAGLVCWGNTRNPEDSCAQCKKGKVACPFHSGPTFLLPRPHQAALTTLGETLAVTGSVTKGLRFPLALELMRTSKVLSQDANYSREMVVADLPAPASELDGHFLQDRQLMQGPPLPLKHRQSASRLIKRFTKAREEQKIIEADERARRRAARENPKP